MQWGKQAQSDRESIYVYLYQEAGVDVATTVDEKFTAMARLLEETPLAGVRAGKKDNQRKLIMPRLPFIMVYAVATNVVRILRILHMSRKITRRYEQH